MGVAAVIAAEILDALLAAGATAEMIVAAVKADAAKDALAVEAKRAKDRERQRRHRESRDVTPCHSDGADSPSLDKSPPQTPLKINPIPCVRDAREGRWHRLPDEWQPARPLPAAIQAKADQWPPGALDDALADFRRWAVNAANTNGKGRKLDWDQAWRNWVTRRHDERFFRTHPLSGTRPGEGSKPPDGLSPTTRAARAVFGSNDPG